MSGDYTVRRARSDEIPALVELAAESLGWEPGRPNEGLFRWKHVDNPAGPSPMWVADAGGRLIGFRAFLRWRFIASGRRWNVVRAVDTATHPDHQRKGIFTALTTAALAELEAEGTDLVFNTPNDQSLPGYLRMGWIELGRLPVAVRPARPTAVLRMVTARQAAEKWSSEVEIGDPAGDALADDGLVDRFLATDETRPVGTELSAEHLRWRYGFEPLRYRVINDADAAVVFRVRRRGPVRECAVCEVVGQRGAVGRLMRRLALSGETDYLLRLGRADLRAGFLRAYGQGPVLTSRSLCRSADGLAGWVPSLGDIELF